MRKFVVGLLTGLLLIVVVVTSSESAPTPAYAPTTYSVPAEVKPVVDRLGITDRTVKIKTDFPCKPGARACFDTAIHFPLTSLQLGEQEQNAVLAHEYMHYVYTKLNDTDRTKYEQLAVGVYNQSELFQKRMKWYVERNILDNDEILAVACTEVSDSILPAELYQYCVKYLPNRLVLPSNIR